jgi:hypothetical protein
VGYNRAFALFVNHELCTKMEGPDFLSLRCA